MLNLHVWASVLFAADAVELVYSCDLRVFFFAGVSFSNSCLSCRFPISMYRLSAVESWLWLRCSSCKVSECLSRAATSVFKLYMLLWSRLIAWMLPLMVSRIWPRRAR